AARSRRRPHASCCAASTKRPIGSSVRHQSDVWRTHRAVRTHAAVVVALLLVAAALPSRAAAQGAGLVKITPLGSHAGELCRNDRAMVFEDPTGVRILYDPGRTVDETDPRLGDVHVMLLSHAHTDHIGDARPNRSAPGTCAAPAAGAANPNTNLAAIAALKNSAVFSPGELDP